MNSTAPTHEEKKMLRSNTFRALVQVAPTKDIFAIEISALGDGREELAGVSDAVPPSDQEVFFLREQEYRSDGVAEMLEWISEGRVKLYDGMYHDADRGLMAAGDGGLFGLS